MQTCLCLRILRCRGNSSKFLFTPLQTQLKVILARRRRVGVGVGGRHGGSPRWEETGRMIDGVVVGL